LSVWGDTGPPEFDNLRDLIVERAKEYGSNLFLNFEGRKMSYEEIDEKSNSLANGLMEAGIGKGDHVAIWMSNRPEYIELLFALAKIGATAVTVSSQLRAEDGKYIINDSDAVAIIVGEECLQIYQKIKDELGKIRRAYYLIDNEYLSKDETENLSTDGMEELRELYSEDVSLPKDVSIEKSTPFSIIYTSGTTGLPKGVLLPHYAYINTGHWHANYVLEADDADVFFTCLPLNHCNAQIFTTTTALTAGGSIAMVKKFSASRFFDQIREYNATIFNFIGMMLVAIYKQPERDDDADNPAELGFGIPIPVDIAKEFERRFDVILLEGYGATETGCGFVFCTRRERKLGAAGKVLPYAEIMIVDENDEPLPAGKIGEIIMRPKITNVWMKEYYKKPEKTVKAWRNLWLHLDDMGYIDEEGWLYFAGRKGDWIRRRGINISAIEIENVLDSHPKVFKSAVIGVPSELTEMEVKAFVVPKPGVEISPEEIIEYLLDRIASYKIPRYIEIVDEFPTTPTGKIQKHLLSRDTERCWDREIWEKEKGMRLR